MSSPALLFAFLFFSCFCAGIASGKTRTFYLAAVEVDWDYAPRGNLVNEDTASSDKFLLQKPDRIGTVYSKILYRQYTDASFTKQIPPLPAQGMLGPTLRAETGDVIVVYFKNLVQSLKRRFSIHPHGVQYEKNTEGALYVDNTSGKDKNDDGVAPGNVYRYVWHVPLTFGPMAEDDACLPWVYHSHVSAPSDVDSGLVGMILTCKPGTLWRNGPRKNLRRDVGEEFSVYLDTTDENRSWMIAHNLQRCLNHSTCNTHHNHKDKSFEASNKMSHINGRVYGNAEGLRLPSGQASLPNAFYFFSVNFGVTSVHVSGQVMAVRGLSVDSIMVFPTAFVAAYMKPSYPGHWLMASRSTDTFTSGQQAFVEVTSSDPSPKSPYRNRMLRHTQSSPDVSGNPGFSQATLQEDPDAGKGGDPGPLNESSSVSPVREYFLAIEDYLWNYGPSGRDLYDGDSLTKAGSFAEIYFQQGPHRIGGSYLKSRFVQYADSSFTTRVSRAPEEEHLGMLGPVLVAEVGEEVKVTIKNMAIRPYSFLPHGVVFSKESEGFVYKNPNTNTLQGRIAEPNSSTTYKFKVPPLTDSDLPCITRSYHSAVDPVKDVNTGLLGPLVLCKPGQVGDNGATVHVVQRRELCHPQWKLYMYDRFQIASNFYWCISRRCCLTRQRAVTQGQRRSTGIYTTQSRSKQGGSDAENHAWFQKHKHLFLNFFIVNENLSWHLQDNINLFTSDPGGVDVNDASFQSANRRHGINGYMFGNLPGLRMCLGSDVAWHIFGAGGEKDLHGVNFQGQALEVHGNHISSKVVVPGTAVTLTSIPDTVGNWSVACGTSSHFSSGMKGLYEVEACDFDDLDLDFDLWHLQGRTRRYYLAAVEVMWDYAPLLRDLVTGLNFTDHPKLKGASFVTHSKDLIGSVYKKARYVQYTDDTFTKERPRSPEEDHLGILGPVLKAEVGDTVEVMFLNKASRPFSVHAQGVQYDRSSRGDGYGSDGGQNSGSAQGVQYDRSSRGDGYGFDGGQNSGSAQGVQYDRSSRGDGYGSEEGQNSPGDQELHSDSFANERSKRLNEYRPHDSPDDGLRTGRSSAENEPKKRHAFPADGHQKGPTSPKGKFRTKAQARKGPSSPPVHGQGEGRGFPGDSVLPGERFTYTWRVPPRAGPGYNDPNCVPWIYHSSVDPVRDTNSGLVGPLVICRPGILTDVRRGESRATHESASCNTRDPPPDGERSSKHSGNFQNDLGSKSGTVITHGQSSRGFEQELVSSVKNYPRNEGTLNSASISTEESPGDEHTLEPILDITRNSPPIAQESLDEEWRPNPPSEIEGELFSNPIPISPGNRVSDGVDRNPTLPQPRTQTEPLFPASEGASFRSDVDREFWMLYTVFDENLSWYFEDNLLLRSPQPRNRPEERDRRGSTTRDYQGYRHPRSQPQQHPRQEDKSSITSGTNFENRDRRNDEHKQQQTQEHSKRHASQTSRSQKGYGFQSTENQPQNQFYRADTPDLESNKIANSKRSLSQTQFHRADTPDLESNKNTNKKRSLSQNQFHRANTPDLESNKKTKRHVEHESPQIHSKSQSPQAQRNSKPHRIHRRHSDANPLMATYHGSENRKHSRGPHPDVIYSKSNRMKSINGRVYGNVEGLVMEEGDTVAWYVLGLGSSTDYHPVHFHGQTFTRSEAGGRRHRGDVVEVFPMTSSVVEMTCDNPGTWLVHCHFSHHVIGGMEATYTVLPRSRDRKSHDGCSHEYGLP